MRRIPDKEETDKDTEKRDNQNTGEPHGCDRLTVSDLNQKSMMIADFR